MIRISPEIRKLNFQDLLTLEKVLKKEYQELVNQFAEMARHKTEIWNDIKAVEKRLNQLKKMEMLK